jgi:hypothetical protein
MINDYYLTIIGANYQLNNLLTTSGSIIRALLLTLSVLHISELNLEVWQLLLLIPVVITVLDNLEEVSVKDKDLRIGFNAGIVSCVVSSLMFVLMGVFVDINTLVIILSGLVGIITIGVKLIRSIRA